ncbi:MAG: CBS domain-containing protein, partial [Armatimonadetes bacterium]|nr:CBS domain-containing protein [Armatimonadota bacterium]
SVIAMRYGIPVANITLYPIGGVASIEKRPKPKQELWIALAGPAVNVVIALALCLVLTLQPGPLPTAAVTRMGIGGVRGFLMAVLQVNVMLVLFNLIPAFPMDGGRVLRAVLAMHLPEVRATQIAAGVGQFIAVAAGLFALLSGNLWYLLIAFFVYIGAGQEAGAYRQAALIEGVHVREAMITDIRTLSVGNTLKEAADVLLDTSQHDFPVLHGDTVQGVLTRNDLLRALAEQGPGGYVAGAMNRQFATAGPDDDLSETLPRLQGAPGPLLVLDGDRLLGIVTGENVAEFFAIRQIAAARNGRQAGI